MEQPPSANKTNERGVVLLISVLIATAVGVAIGTSVILAGLVLGQSSVAHREQNQAKSLANACAEVALEQIRLNTAYSGSSSATISGSTCNYTVTTGSGEARTVTANNTTGNSTRRVTIQISAITPSITVTSWQEQ